MTEGEGAASIRMRPPRVLPVRFGLGHFVEVCRGQMVQVGVLVPVRPRFRDAILAADARRAGFLMKDARRVGGDAATTIEFGGKP